MPAGQQPDVGDRFIQMVKSAITEEEQFNVCQCMLRPVAVSEAFGWAVVPLASSLRMSGPGGRDKVGHGVIGIFRFAFNLPAETGCLAARPLQLLRQPRTAFLTWQFRNAVGLRRQRLEMS